MSAEISEASKPLFKLRVALPDRSLWWETDIYLANDPPMLYVTVEDDQLFIGTIDDENERAGVIFPLVDDAPKGPIIAHDIWLGEGRQLHGSHNYEIEEIEDGDS